MENPMDTNKEKRREELLREAAELRGVISKATEAVAKLTPGTTTEPLTENINPILPPTPESQSKYKVGDKIRFRTITGNRTLEGKITAINSERFSVYSDSEGRYYTIKKDQIEEILQESPEVPKPRTAQIPVNEPLPASASAPKITPAPAAPEPAPAPIEKDQNKKETAPKTPEEEVNNFISEFNLAPLLPDAFKSLNEAQKLKVVRDLKHRIVDIVKADAQTQYSQTLKDKVVGDTSVAGGILAGIAKKIKNLPKAIGIGLKASATKERDLKNLEAEAFKNIRTTHVDLIKRDLEILTERVSKQHIGHWGKGELEDRKKSSETKPFVYYLEVSNQEEQNFNRKAHLFTQIPYEWGQEKSGNHKKEYEKAKAEYRKARNEIIKIRTKEIQEGRIDRRQAIVELAELDNMIRMEQLLHTHPEFEQALTDFGESAEGMEWGKTGKKALTSTLTKEGIGISTVGGIARGLTKVATGYVTGNLVTVGSMAISSAGAITFIAAPIIGGAIGYWRGKVRGKKTLEERKKAARHGQKDENKEAANIVSAENLNKRLEEIILACEKAERSESDEKYKMRTDQIKRRIEYTKDKIEKGLVNFGNTKTSLINQFDLINNLNKALIISVTFDNTGNKEINERLEKFLAYKSKNISEAEKEFKNKQALIGAGIGAGFATIGYGVRYLGEHLGWWGGNTPTDKPAIQQQAPERAPIAEAKIPTHTPTTPPDTIENPPADPETTSTPSAPVDSLPENDISNPAAQQTETPEATTTPITPPDTIESVTIKKGEGAIQKIIDLKQQIRTHYAGDYSKAPENIQKLMSSTNVLQQSKDLGFFDPDKTDESALLGEGSTISVNYETGNISLHDTITNKDSILIDGDGVHKYTGTMFNSEHTTPDLEINNKIETPIPPQVESDDYTGDAVAYTEDMETKNISPEKETTPIAEEYNKDEAIKKLQEELDQNYKKGEIATVPKAPTEEIKHAALENLPRKPRVGDVIIKDGMRFIITGVGPAGYNYEFVPLNSLGGHGEYFPELTPEQNSLLGQHPEFVRGNPFNLTGSKLVEVYDIHQKNIAHIFQTHPRGLDTWQEMKGQKASVLLEDKNTTEENPLIKYIKKLQEITKLKPEGGLIRRPETTEHYIARALQKVAALGKLKEIKY